MHLILSRLYSKAWWKELTCLFLMVMSVSEAVYPSYIPSTGVLFEYEPKDFSFLLSRLKGVDDELLKLHFSLYQGYVKNANTLNQMLKELQEKGDDKSLIYGALKRRLSWEYDGMVLHEYYFGNLSNENNTLNQESALYRKIADDFGSFESWKENFMATGLIRGIGWVILYLDPKDGRLQNIWVDDHHINHIAGGDPILVMDVWEHAYITQFGLDRMRYIEVFLSNIDWKAVSKRFLITKSISK